MKLTKLIGIFLGVSSLFAITLTTIYLNIFSPALFLFLMLGYGIYLIDNEKTK